MSSLNLGAVEPLKPEKEFENEFMRLEKRGDILFGWYKEGPITLELAKEVVRIRLEFMENTPMKMVAGEKGLKGIDRDARQYLSSDEGMQGILAGAMVTKSSLAAHLANFLIRFLFYKTKVPVRLCTSEQDALKWLNSLN